MLAYAARHAKRSWIRAVQDDLKFLTSNGTHFAEMHDAPIKEWVAIIRANPASMKAAML